MIVSATLASLDRPSGSRPDGLGHRRAHDQDRVRVHEILLRRRRPPATERSAQTGHRGAMSYPGLVADRDNAQSAGESFSSGSSLHCPASRRRGARIDGHCMSAAVACLLEMALARGPHAIGHHVHRHARGRFSCHWRWSQGARVCHSVSPAPDVCAATRTSRPGQDVLPKWATRDPFRPRRSVPAMEIDSLAAHTAGTDGMHPRDLWRRCPAASARASRQSSPPRRCRRRPSVDSAEYAGPLVSKPFEHDSDSPDPGGAQLVKSSPGCCGSDSGFWRSDRQVKGTVTRASPAGFFADRRELAGSRR